MVPKTLTLERHHLIADLQHSSIARHNLCRIKVNGFCMPARGEAIRVPPICLTKSISRADLIQAFGPPGIIVHHPFGKPDRALDRQPQVSDSLAQIS